MATPDSAQLASAIREKTKEFAKLCAGLDEKTASRAPEGRWSPKQIVSHLIGGEGGGFMVFFDTILKQETPELNLDGGNDHFSGKRAEMSMAQLLAQFERDYGRMADFVSGLTPAQLERKGHIPALKESPLGEYPSLGTLIGGIAGHHLNFHIDHMKEILQGLGAA